MSASTGSRLPTCKLSAVGSKPMYAVTELVRSSVIASGDVTWCTRPRASRSAWKSGFFTSVLMAPAPARQGERAAPRGPGCGSGYRTHPHESSRGGLTHWHERRIGGHAGGLTVRWTAPILPRLQEHGLPLLHR